MTNMNKSSKNNKFVSIALICCIIAMLSLSVRVILNRSEINTLKEEIVVRTEILEVDSMILSRTSDLTTYCSYGVNAAMERSGVKMSIYANDIEELVNDVSPMIHKKLFLLDKLDELIN